MALHIGNSSCGGWCCSLVVVVAADIVVLDGGAKECNMLTKSFRASE